jgi:conjugative relaxase-like TrwC/TraI family protein
MLTPKAQYKVGDAKKYFREHLCAGDYYTEGQHVPGYWLGQGATDLGLSGVTTEEQFARLCDNLHLQTGERLTQRHKTTRTELDAEGNAKEAANRRVFYDFTFSPPKSVSIAALVADDQRIVEAHEQAVTTALDQLQSFAATRVRKQGQCSDRTTGNLVAAVFRLDTSRALDPHLHSHAIVFNATFDPVERRWKALQNHDMLAAQKFVENVYYHELSRELVLFGYQIENRPRGDFDIKGIVPAVREKFSQRHRQIDDQTRELLAREPEKAHGNIAAIRENLAHRERPRKIRDLALAKLQGMWNDQLTQIERESLRTVTRNEPALIEPAAGVSEKAVMWAEEHLFDRRSVVHEHELWRHALEQARGQNVSVKELQAVTRGRDYVRNAEHPGQVSTREHLRREWEIILLARDGLGEFHPLVFDYLMHTNGSVLATFLNPAGYASAAPGERITGHNPGVVHLLHTNGTWLASIPAPRSSVVDEFGCSLAVVGEDKLLIGVRGSSLGAVNSGAAYLYSFAGTPLARFPNPTPAQGDFFGWAVTVVGGNLLFMSAYGEATFTGIVYGYDLTDHVQHLETEFLDGNQLRPSWPASISGFYLDVADSFSAPAAGRWTRVQPPYHTNATHISVTVPASGSKFYRLSKAE